MRTAKVPDKFEPLFEQAQQYVAEYFANRTEQPERGTIELSGQRYMLVRAGAMSVEFFEMVRGLYPGDDEREALSVARSLLFDIAHAMGLADAKVFAARMGMDDPLARLSAGPIHFAHAGWAFVEILDESNPTPDEDFYLVYDHPYSFESDSWLSAKKASDSPVCVMSAGYSSGWCESSFRLELVASEITCRAKGDRACRFIMAPPSRIEERIRAYLRRHPGIRAQVTSFEVPGFFARKQAEDALKQSHEQLKRANEELERRVRQRTQELEQANASLERDIQERMRTEEALSASEELNRRIVDALPGGLVHVLADGSIVHANAEACRMYGLSYDEMVQRYAVDFETITYHENGQPAVVTDFPVTPALATGKPQGPKVFGVRRPSGELAWGLYTAVPLLDRKTGATTGAIVTFLDITERKRAEQERRRLEAKLLQTQKLESLGVLAGGIAHDFNNLLVGVMGNAALARELCERGSELDELLVALEEAAQRAQDLTRQMLAYSGKGHFRIERVNLSHEVSRMVPLLNASMPKRVSIDYELADAAPDIDVDVTQLRQVIMSLVTNAAESIERSGSVRVATGATHLTEIDLTSCTHGEGVLPGDYVYVEVTDTGLGISEAARGKIFDPFFTTKFSGRGLGLAAVLGIVRGHRGAIQLHSKPGAGSQFRVLFPCASVRLELDARAQSLSHPNAQRLLLLIDDDAAVLAVMNKTLQAAGFETLCASSGREGVRLYELHHRRLAAVILDLTMPDISGTEVFSELKRIKSEIPVVLVSGYAEEEAAGRFASRGLAGFLAKPFTPAELRKIVTQAIESD